MSDGDDKKNENSNQAKIVESGDGESSPLKKFLQNSDVLLMLYPKDEEGNFSGSIGQRDEISIYKLLKEKDDLKESLLILLDTSGGNIYSAVKIMDTLRTKYKKIIIAIPQEAKSSGTMMCCGADKLIMSPISELGPLDKPMFHPGKESKRIISALDIIKSIDGMLDTAKIRQIDLAREINNDMDVPIKESLMLASHSISKLISPMLCREDVKIYNQAKRLIEIAVTFSTEFLNNHMLKYVKKEKLRKRMADLITRRLIWNYPDHSFAIRRSELKDWLFVIKDAEEIDFWDELWGIFESNIGENSKKIINFLKL